MDETSLDKRTLAYAIVDVFTDQRYKGNPLAIVRVPDSVSLSYKQKLDIAREFNLSETTFLHESETSSSNHAWTVDIFMVTGELPFAGHPTVGTACYLLRRLAEQHAVNHILQAQFNLKAGAVQLHYDALKNKTYATIPHNVHTHQKTWPREAMLSTQPRLAQTHGQGAREGFPIVSIVKGMTFILIKLESLEMLQLVDLTGSRISVEGLDEGWDATFVGAYYFVRVGEAPDGTVLLRTRMIEGILEDPATGSAACDLAAHLSLVDGRKNFRFKYAITQGVEMGRQSEIEIEVVLGESSIDQVLLGGGAVEVMEGSLVI